MAEASPVSAAHAFRAWLAAPHDPIRIKDLADTATAGAADATAVTKLPIAALAALRAVKWPVVHGLRPHVRQALLVAGLAANAGLQATADEARELDGLPFSVVFTGHEVVVEIVSVQPSQRFGSPFLHQWIAGIHADAVVIECGRLNHVNSVLIAWMLQMVQSAKPIPVRIRHAKAQVVTQLKQLRLDHLMHIE